MELLQDNKGFAKKKETYCGLKGIFQHVYRYGF